MADPTKSKYDDKWKDIFRDYYDKGMTERAIAERYEIPMSTVHKYLGLKKYNDKWSAIMAERERRAEARRRSAALKAIDASPQMMDQLISIASQDVGSTDIKFQYAIHNAAAAVLDRAGVGVKQEESKEVHVVLDSGIDLGEPE